MAISLGRGPNDDDPMAEINVTPFVDVVLVLLIIFMITAGVFDFGLEIDVPQTRQVAVTQHDYPFINITATGEIYYNTEPIRPEDIADRVQRDADFNKDGNEKPGIYLRAHRTTPWEVISPIVEMCGRSEIAVAMVTKPLERNPQPE